MNNGKSMNGSRTSKNAKTGPAKKEEGHGMEAKAEEGEDETPNGAGLQGWKSVFEHGGAAGEEIKIEDEDESESESKGGAGGGSKMCSGTKIGNGLNGGELVVLD